ncbi:hypothetical protein BGZ98_000598 [Dissophora globulifera]|nr:hypothetical protein BGZ98_000598 [Dissophora globulifera]
MTDNSYLSLIEGLNNSEDSLSSPSAASPEDYAAELSLWTNAEFTFDIPPGFGIYDTDSGFDQIAVSNTLAGSSTSTASTGTGSAASNTHQHDPVLGQQIDQRSQQPQGLDFLNLSSTVQQDSRLLSLLERTRQRNPLNEEPKPEVQEQVAAINTFHSLLAAYSAAATQAQQQLQQPKQMQHQYPAIQPAVAPAFTSAPTTPAAAKLLRQPLTQLNKSAPPAKKQKTVSSSSPTTLTAPSTALTASTLKEKTAAKGSSTISAIAVIKTESARAKEAAAAAMFEGGHDDDDEPQHQLSAADSFSRDDPDYTSKVAAEEDKRRRNTAASARFRQKKKLREQALEVTAREQTQRAETLEGRVRELEMEVRWLRGLIVEKDSRLHEATVSLRDANSESSL